MKSNKSPPYKSILGLLEEQRTKTKGEKTPPHIFVDRRSELDMSSLVSKANGDSIVSKSGAPLEEFDPFPFFSVKDGNLLEINPQKKAEI